MKLPQKLPLAFLMDDFLVSDVVCFNAMRNLPHWHVQLGPVRNNPAVFLATVRELLDNAPECEHVPACVMVVALAVVALVVPVSVEPKYSKLAPRSALRAERLEKHQTTLD